MAPPTRIVMLGTGDFALPTFVHLCRSGHRVERLITQPDRPQGRKQELIASPIERGEHETGVTVIRMTPQIDAGGMIAIARTPIDPDETAGMLEERLAALGAPLIASAIATLEAGTARVLPQEKARVTKAPKLRK